MYWIFPMAGKGSRVKSLGKYKPFIRINNKSIFEWFYTSIDNKINTSDKLIFITTKKNNIENNFKKKILSIVKKKKIKKIFKYLDEIPNGPANTINLAIEHLKNANEPCIIINPDQFIDFNLPKKIYKKKIYLALHYNCHGNSSYVNLNKDFKIDAIEEKKLISNYASSGVYLFGSAQHLKFLFKKISFLKSNNVELNVSDLLKLYLKKKNNFCYPIETMAKYDLGNIQGIKKFRFKLIKTK